MKYLLLGVFSGITLLANAQTEGGNRGERNKNILLNQSFWQEKPGVEVVKAEIEKGNNPAETNDRNFDPIVMAINAGESSDVVIFLLGQQDVDPNKITHEGRTYLHWAAAKGDVVVMEYLISKGAKVTTLEEHGLSASTFAATAGQQNTRLYDLCLQNGINFKTDLTADGANALLLAAGTDTSLKLTEYFQQKGVDIKSKDANGNTAFDYAARAGNIKAMKALRAKGVPFTDNAMLMAAQGSRRSSNTIDVYQYLESVGIKPGVTSQNGENALHFITRRSGQAEIIKYFISKGVAVNAADADGNTVFMDAAASNHDTATLSMLIPLIKDINQKNNAGATALALATSNNTADAMQLLINHGAAINTIDKKGYNLAYYLFDAYSRRTARDFEPKLEVLKNAGIDLKAPQKDGSTLYHVAIGKNDLSLVKMVQSLGIDVNAKNTEGITPLHKAAMVAKDDTIMQYLLSVGAKKEPKTNFDETAYDLAKENEVLSKRHVSIDFLKI